MDRPGIVAALTGVLLANDCNIEDSQMSRLGPNFACMLIIRMPEGMVSEQLSGKFLEVAKDYALWLHVQDLRPEEASAMYSEQHKHLIHVYGADRKGIVHKITQHLADKSINISNLHTEVIQHDQPLYVMMIEVEIPSFVDVGETQDELREIGRDINVTVDLKPKEDARF